MQDKIPSPIKSTVAPVRSVVRRRGKRYQVESRPLGRYNLAAFKDYGCRRRRGRLQLAQRKSR